MLDSEEPADKCQPENKVNGRLESTPMNETKLAARCRRLEYCAVGSSNVEASVRIIKHIPDLK